MMNAALSYAARGWRVFPCKPYGKTPITEHGCLDATTDPGTIRAWWERTPNANIGVATGRESGITVIDLDGDEGIKSGKDLDLTSTVWSITGNGAQLFYQYAPIKNSVKKIAPGIDTRNDSGYVIVPPSLHPGGKRYQWLLNVSKELPEFPSNVLALIASEKSSLSTSISITDGWVSQALNSLQEGNRNDTFARVVGKLHSSGLDKTTIWTLLLPHAMSSGLGEHELNNVIQSISRYPTVSSEQSADMDIESFLKDNIPVEWICNPICAKGALGFVAGLPEAYKTWVLMDLAIECARGGGLWLGLYPVTSAKVLFIDQERSKSESQRRLRSVMVSKGIAPSQLKDRLFIKSGTTIRLDIDESFRAFKRCIEEIKPDLILVDSFATFHVSDENDRMTIQKVMERVKELRTEFGCAIVFVDHENKAAYSDKDMGIAPSAGRLAGSVGKIAAAEFVLTVRRYDPETCVVYHTKSTMGERVKPFAVHVTDTDGGGVRVWGEVAK